MLEVCVDTIQAAIIAEKGGANRIELCSALDLGGVTPSGPLILAVRRSISLPLIVLIRSRAGDFHYDELDCDLMVEEAKQAVKLGADGIAVGGLVVSMDLDLTFLRSIVNALPKCQLVMHRAFDHVREPLVALESLVELGFTRILTSGGPEMAIDGVDALRRLCECAQGRIEILPAGGIGPANALEILTKSGANQLHGSFRESRDGKTGGGKVIEMLPKLASIQHMRAILTSIKRRGRESC